VASAAYYAVAVIAAAAAGYKYAQGRGGAANPGSLYLCGTISCMALTLVALAPLTLTAASRVEPVPNLARLIGNGIAVIAAYCMHGMLAYAVLPPHRARRRLRLEAGLAAVVLVAMTVLLTSAGTRFTVDFVDVYGGRPLVAAYEVVFLGYSAWGLGAVVRLIRRYALHAEKRALRLGLQAFMAGAVIGLFWVVWKGTVTIVKVTTHRPAPIEGIVSTWLSAAGIALLAVGATMTAWGPLAIAPLRWIRSYRAYRRLEPLWSAVSTALPEIALAPATGPVGRSPLTRIEFALYRRVIEIRDGHLALRVYFHPDVPSIAAQAAAEAGVRDATRVTVIVEASVIGAALLARAAGHRYHAEPSDADVPYAVEPSIESETAWLAAVAQAFARSPVVERVRQRVRAELDGSVGLVPQPRRR
jgi:hypothetical protein